MLVGSLGPVCEAWKGRLVAMTAGSRGEGCGGGLVQHGDHDDVLCRLVTRRLRAVAEQPAQ